MASIGKKSINAQINQILARAKQTNVLVSALDLIDKSGSIDVPQEVMMQILSKVSQKYPNLALLIVSAGVNSCEIAAMTPVNSFPSYEWINACGKTTAEENKNIPEYSSLKQRDQLMQNAFTYLREHGHMPEDDESSEECYFDINA